MNLSPLTLFLEPPSPASSSSATTSSAGLPRIIFDPDEGVEHPVEAHAMGHGIHPGGRTASCPDGRHGGGPAPSPPLSFSRPCEKGYRFRTACPRSKGDILAHLVLHALALAPVST